MPRDRVVTKAANTALQMLLAALLAAFLAACVSSPKAESLRGTGDLGLIIERMDGSLLVVEHSGNTVLGRIEGLGDLSHASVVFSRDERYGYVFGRDGGLTKVDMLTRTLVKRTVQGGNSIGGAISQDGQLVAVSNYTPGGVKVFDADTLGLIADIPAISEDGGQSKVVGLVDAPGRRFLFSLFEAGEIWMADFGHGNTPIISKYPDAGAKPYDALITPDGRHYLAGLFDEDGLALMDLWEMDKGPRKILSGYGRGEMPLPVYKMPHLEGWAMAGGLAFLPAVGREELLVVDADKWTEKTRIPLHGQPVFAMSRPDGRHIWVNFAFPNNDTIQVIDVKTLSVIKTLKPGKGVMHMEFTPRGEAVWLSVRDEDRVEVYDTATFSRIKQLPAQKPSGIFFTDRAHRIGL